MPYPVKPLSHAQGLRVTLSLQLLRYAVVGLAANIAGFLFYLGLTWYGMGHKMAMTLLFLGTVLLTFYANHSWTFHSTLSYKMALGRYFALYVCGYFINWLGLWVLVDNAGYPHQRVQLAMIFIVAIFLFINLRLWVFK